MFVVFAIIDQVIPPSIEFSHCTTLPTLPPRVSVPLFTPLQTVAEAGAMVPPIDAAVTFTAAVAENTGEHVPLIIRARYKRDTVRFEKFKVVVVLVIADQVTPPSIENSQRFTAPVCPLSVKVPLLVGAHTDVTAGAIDPPTEAGDTVTVAIEE